MTLEQQVVSLDLSKRLKELGVKQESLFLYVKDKPTKSFHLWYWEVYAIGGAFPTKEWAGAERFAAFTVAELLDLLGMDYVVGKAGEMDNLKAYDCMRILEGRVSMTDEMIVAGTSMDNPADAAAGMLIYLLENNLIPHA